MERVTLIARPCPVCGADNPAQGSAEELPDVLDFIGRDRVNAQAQLWHCCPNCDTEYVPQAQSETWYLNRYRMASVTDEDLDARATATALHLWDQGPVQKVASVLEWGCGRGLFLQRLAERGLRVAGLEPNERLREKARIPVYDPDRLAALGAPPFDALVLQLSLEHIYNPLDLLLSSRAFLNPGALLMIQYHNAAGFFHKLMGTRSPLYDMQHLQIFAKPDMHRLTRAAGFERLYDQGYANAYPLGYWARLAGLEAVVPRNAAAYVLKIPAGNRVYFGRMI